MIRALSLAGAAGLLAGCNGDAATPSESGADVAAGRMPDDLWRASAGELAAAIRRGEVSSLDVVESHLARVDAVNGHLNAVVRVLADEARAAAQAADEAVAAGEELGPLHGVPISVKDNIAVAGTPTTNGVPAYAEQNAERDALIVRRLKDAGAIVLTRTNLPDLGLRVHTDSYLYGVTRNPWAADPQRRRLERRRRRGAGQRHELPRARQRHRGLASHPGPVQRHRIAQADSGPDRERHRRQHVRSVDGRRRSDGPPRRRSPHRLRASGEVPPQRSVVGPPSPSTWIRRRRRSRSRSCPSRAAARPTRTSLPACGPRARRSKPAGYAVEEVEPPMAAEARRAWEVFLGYELNTARQALKEIMSPDAYDFLARGLEMFDAESPAEYEAMYGQRHAIASAWQEFQEDFPVTVGPIMTQPPFVVGYDLQDPGDVLDQMRFEVALNLLGLPAVCVPTGVADGLPQVVEVIGGRYREGLCLEAAQAIEDALGIVTPIDPVMA